jgi:hypothetical protein
MARTCFVLVAWLLGGWVLSGARVAQVNGCLHGEAETSSQKARRDRAMALAARINQAEAMQRGGPGRLHYRPLGELPNIPPAPPGFDLRFRTDGLTYEFSIKDRLDPCHYAIFSDDERELYEATANTGPVVLPATTTEP